MANVYSKELYRVVSAVSSTTWATVPAGYVWTIRCVTLYNSGTIGVANSNWGSVLSGILLTVGVGGPVICGVMNPWARANHPYTFDLHHVLNAGDILTGAVGDNNWSVYVSGYQLTLP